MTTLHSNFLALGSCVAGMGILIAGLLALLFRHPNAPRWTQPEIVVMLVCVPVTATIGFGLGYITYGLYQIVNGAGDPRGLLVLAAVLVVLALLWRSLRIRQRLKDYAVVTSDVAASESLATEPILEVGEAPSPRPSVRRPTAGPPESPA